jgi:hypothetical protein
LNKGLFKGMSNSQADRGLGSGDVVLSLTKQKSADFVDMRANTIIGSRGIRFGSVTLNDPSGANSILYPIDLDAAIEISVKL